MRTKIHTLVLSLTISAAAIAQVGDWSVSPYLAQNMVFGDTDFDHPTQSINLGTGFQVKYGAAKNLWVYSDVSYGSINGGNSQLYYESQFFQGLMGAQYNVLGGFGVDSKLEAYIDGSLGWAFVQANGFDRESGNILTRIPTEGAYTQSPSLGIGAILNYPISNQVDITAGYRLFWMYDNDWVDGFNTGSSTDYIGQFSLGLCFRINGHTPMAKVSVNDYDDLVAAKKAAEQERDQAQEDLDMARSRYETQIEDLYNVLSIMNNNIDSLNEKITVLKSNPDSPGEYTVETRNGEPVSPDASNTQWRIVIGSYPSAELARSFADRRIVEGGNYEVVYIADLNTFRVVYDSYPSLVAAKNDLTRVKHTIADAWIIKF